MTNLSLPSYRTHVIVLHDGDAQTAKNRLAMVRHAGLDAAQAAMESRMNMGGVGEIVALDDASSAWAHGYATPRAFFEAEYNDIGVPFAWLAANKGG